MKLSAREQYGLRAMIELGRRHTQGPVSLSDVAQAQSISLGYLEQIVPFIKPTGLILTKRGASGGYQLSRDPKKINLREILSPLEGGLTIIDCPEGNSTCANYKNCVTRDVWHTMEHMFVDYLEKTKLADLIKNLPGNGAGRK